MSCAWCRRLRLWGMAGTGPSWEQLPTPAARTQQRRKARSITTPRPLPHGTLSSPSTNKASQTVGCCGSVHSTRWRQCAGNSRVSPGPKVIAPAWSAILIRAPPLRTVTHSVSAWSYQNPSGEACPNETIRSSRTALPATIVRVISASREAGSDVRRFNPSRVVQQPIRALQNCMLSWTFPGTWPPSCTLTSPMAQNVSRCVDKGPELRRHRGSLRVIEK
jgi:hypothetical protein